jgi:hypothetical protein
MFSMLELTIRKHPAIDIRMRDKMPNWCQNVLEVSVKSPEQKEQIRNLLLNGEGEFSFNYTVPMPEGLDKVEVTSAVRDSGTPNWYDWSIENWGTKWDVSECDIADTSDRSCSFSFDTAWSPAEAWVAETSKLLPDAEFALFYVELGMEFSGKATYVNGVMVADEHYDDIDFGIWEQMGFSVESFAETMTFSGAKMISYAEREDANHDVIRAMLELIDEMDDEDKPNEAVITLLKETIKA